MMKRSYTDDFVIEEAKYINKNLATYKETSEYFNVPLSTVGWHMKVRLRKLDPTLHSDVMGVIHIYHKTRKLWRFQNENPSVLL